MWPRATTQFFPFFQNMNSAGTPSTEVLSLISDVTDPEEISGDVNAYFQKVTLPEDLLRLFLINFISTRTKEEYFRSLIFKKRPK